MKPAPLGLVLLLAAPAARAQEKPAMMESRLEVLTVATGAREVVHSAPAHFEAPNWSRDGKHLLFNQGGRISSCLSTSRKPRLLDTGKAMRCNNDHGLSPDGKWLADQRPVGGRPVGHLRPARHRAGRRGA